MALAGTVAPLPPASSLLQPVINNIPVKNAVNVPNIGPELMNVLRPYAFLAEKMGSLQAQLVDSGILEVEINYAGKVTEYDVTPLTTATLKGLLTPILKDDVTRCKICSNIQKYLLFKSIDMKLPRSVAIFRV